jgi:magnesium chelatase subunit D
MIDAIAQICSAADVDGLRADLAIYRAAVAHAALHGRTDVTASDLAATARLAIPHRLHEQTPGAPESRSRRIEEALSRVLVG